MPFAADGVKDAVIVGIAHALESVKFIDLKLIGMEFQVARGALHRVGPDLKIVGIAFQAQGFHSLANQIGFAVQVHCDKQNEINEKP